MVTEARLESNKFIRKHAEKVTGKVLSIGSGGDLDWEGSKYRTYFKNSSAYFTSEISPTAKTDLRVDMRDMSQFVDGMFDCIFCAGVLEHVDDMFGAMAETSRITKKGGTLLLGVPFGYAVHRPPQDYWRMTIHGLYYLLERFDFELDDTLTLQGPIKDFPACYWSNSIKK
jgi:SAM-dependent methyltransferase